MKEQKKMVILKKGNDIKKVSEKSFAYFHFLGLGYLIEKSIPKEIKEKVEKEAKNLQKQAEKKKKVEVKIEEKTEKTEE